MGSALRPWSTDFAWGVATAAAQIEGAATIDGRGPSTWDVFARRPGAIFEGHDPTVACDHYGRLDADLDLLAALGVNAYRFSVSWSRVLPCGRGAVNPLGLRFYDRLVDGLLKRNITPYLTLFHWDYPQTLEDAGGFRNPDSSHWFADYATVLARHFAGRVRHYFTLNEPHAFIEGGLLHGRHAPGLTLPLSVVLAAAHNALLSHGRATQLLRAEVPNSWVAFAPVLIGATPATNSAEDLEAARAFTFEAQSTALRASAFWMDPVYRGSYPESFLRLAGSEFPRIDARDLEIIAQPLDVFAANLYDSVVVRAGREGAIEVVPPSVGSPRTAFNWPVTPEGHYYGPLFAWQRYGLPVLISENGLSTRDWVAHDGAVHDDERADFIERHVRELARAGTDGVPLAGYFHWSLLDNFEWNHGYRERFGLVHVDFATGQRTPKRSFEYYRQLVSRERNR